MRFMSFIPAFVWASSLALGVIRGLHSYRKPRAEAAVRASGFVQRVALVTPVIGFILPLVWASTSWLDRFTYDAPLVMAFTGGAIVLAGLWLFHRTHVDIGANWSATLQIREDQRLVTSGLYARVRHPMYLSLLLFGLGQALVIPNWIAGPACLAGTVLLAALRMPAEEAMLEAEFGDAYARYARRTPRIVPRIGG
jgi:protein-S-isoprenylcysteine O-methyltransferase Ste14